MAKHSPHSFYLTINSTSDVDRFTTVKDVSMYAFSNCCNLNLWNHEIAIINCYSHTTDTTDNVNVNPITIGTDVVEMYQFGSTWSNSLRLTNRFPHGDFINAHYVPCVQGTFNKISVFICPATASSKLTKFPELLLTFHFRTMVSNVRRNLLISQS